MDIRCERCATEYEIEDARIPEAGLTIKCATCAHVFKVMRGIAPPPPAFALRLHRDGSDMAANCPDVATLQRWIVEQRVLAADEVSVSGQSWRRLGDVPEFATFFALLSMPPPASMRTPTASPAYGVAPPAPPPADPGLPTVTRPVLQWSPSEPAAAEDNFRTVQVQLTPDMFPAAPAKPPPPPPTTPSGMTGTAWPSLPSLGEGLKLESMPPTAAPVFPPAAPTTHGPAVIPPAAPAPTAHLPAVPSTPKAAPTARASTQAPTTRNPAAKTTAAPKPTAAAKPRHSPESDPDLAAFVASRRNGRLALLAVVGIIVLAAGAYFALPFLRGPKGPSAEAQAAYATGRQIYLLDSATKFPSAEDAFREAAGELPGVYPQAEGARAELDAAWGEQLLARYNALNDQVKALAAAGKDAKALLPQLNQAAADAKGKLGEVVVEVNAVRRDHPENLEAGRALLDYYRLMNDAARADTQAEALKAHTNPETIAHVAAWQAMDPKQAAAAESALKGVVAQLPDFVRARVWLAELHLRMGSVAAANADMQAVLQAAPGQDQATDFLAAQKASAPPTSAAVPDGGVTTTAQATPPPAEAATPKEPTHAESEPKESHPAREAKAETRTASTGPISIDHAIDEAGNDFEHHKYAQALDLYARVLQDRPKLSDALYGRGLALYYLGRTDEAISAFKKTLDVNHRFGDAMLGLAEAYEKEGRNPEAVTYYQQYLDVNPNGAQATMAKANITALKGR